jgi:hypothetical protein
VASPASLRDVAQFGGQFWRIVARNYEGMNESAPEGHTTVVIAYFVGDPTAYPVGVVESSRDNTWFLIHWIIERVDDPTTASPTDRLIFSDESQLSRVEVRYLRDEPESRHPLGFRVEEASEEPSG